MQVQLQNPFRLVFRIYTHIYIYIYIYIYREREREVWGIVMKSLNIPRMSNLHEICQRFYFHKHKIA